ncbi:MAG TPA: XRE family transcriptional regulator [Armatimonadota bacterium]|jgi:transcriptional regulator with XRE-family HTH domain
MVGERLKQLRLARGWSLEALAAEVGGVVSRQAIWKYEHGRANPSAYVLTRLASALGVKSVALWAEPNVRVELVAYRKRSRLTKKEQEQTESFVRQTLEERVALQNVMGQTPDVDLPIRSLHIGSVEEAEAAAEVLRTKWVLGVDPIANVVNVLESHLVHVVEIPTSDHFDGLSAVAYDSEGDAVAAAVVSRDGVSGERQRLNLCHELGHLVLDIAEGVDPEKAAFRFGSAFLAPVGELLRQVGRTRGALTLPELLMLKRQFGMSVQALLYRLRELEVITDQHYKQWCIDINQMGYRKAEPAPVPPEEPQWLRQSVLHALAEGLTTKEEAERLLGGFVEGVPDLSLDGRRNYMQLPAEERRRILEEQAARFVSHYERDTSWRDIQGGDIDE